MNIKDSKQRHILELRKQSVVSGSSALRLSTNPTKRLKILTPYIDIDELPTNTIKLNPFVRSEEQEAQVKNKDINSAQSYLCGEQDYSNLKDSDSTSTSPPPLPPKIMPCPEYSLQNTKTPMWPLVAASVFTTSLAAVTRVNENLFGGFSRYINLTSCVGATFLWTLVVGASISGPSESNK